MASINVRYAAAVPLSHIMHFVVCPMSDKINGKAQCGVMNVLVNAVNGRKPLNGFNVETQRPSLQLTEESQKDALNEGHWLCIKLP